MSKKKKKRKKRKLNGRIVTVTALAGYTTVAVWEKGQASWLRLPAPLHSAQTHPSPSHPQNTPFKPPSSNPRRFSHYSLDSAEAVRRCLVIHSIIIFDYYNSLHFIFRKFMQLNLNHFIKQIVTTLCLAVETFLFSPFPNCHTQPPLSVARETHPPTPFRNRLSKFLQSWKTAKSDFHSWN